MYVLVRGAHLEEKEEYKNYLSKTPECFDELFVLVKDNITKQITNMRDASTLKLKLAAKIFHVHSFVALFSRFFFLYCYLKFRLDVFDPTNLMN